MDSLPKESCNYVVSPRLPGSQVSLPSEKAGLFTQSILKIVDVEKAPGQRFIRYSNSETVIKNMKSHKIMPHFDFDFRQKHQQVPSRSHHRPLIHKPRIAVFPEESHS